MQVCDNCHKVPSASNRGRAPFDVDICVVKHDMKGGKNSRKEIPREIIRISVHICDHCLSEFNKKLGKFVHAMRMNENESEI